MEDRDSIDRGEAIAGLALLGLLGVTLMSAVVYRIVTSAPGAPGPLRPVSIVEVDPAPYGTRATDPGYTAPSAAGEETVEPALWERDAIGARVPATSMDNSARLHQVEPPNAARETLPATSPPAASMRDASRPATLQEAPRFVAPSAR